MIRRAILLTGIIAILLLPYLPLYKAEGTNSFLYGYHLHHGKPTPIPPTPSPSPTPYPTASPTPTPTGTPVPSATPYPFSIPDSSTVCIPGAPPTTVAITDIPGIVANSSTGGVPAANAAALNAYMVTASAAGGATITFPANTTIYFAHDTSSSMTIRFKSHIHFECADHTAIIKSTDQSYTSAQRLMGVGSVTGETVTDVLINNCTIDGGVPVYACGVGCSQQGHATFWYTTDPGTVTNVTITNNLIKDVPGDGVQMSANSSGICVRDNYIQQVGRAGIGAGGVGAVRGSYYVIGNTVIPTEGYVNSRGIDLETAAASPLTNVVIENNTINQIQSAGSISTTTGNWVINNNTINYAGMNLGCVNHLLVSHNSILQAKSNVGLIIQQRAYDVTIDDNTIDVTTPNYEGIYIAPSVQGGNGVTVTNNIVTKTGTSTKAGIRVSFSPNTTVTGNTVSGFWGGVEIDGASTFPVSTVLIDTNSLTASSLGILTGDYITGCTIKNNNPVSGGTSDIKLTGTNAHSSGFHLCSNTLTHSTILNVNGLTYDGTCS